MTQNKPEQENFRTKQQSLPIKRLKRAWRFLARLDLGAMLILVILLLVAFGACFPQRPPETCATPEQLAQWEGAIQARYGGLSKLLDTLGAFQWYTTPVFRGALGFLGLLTLVCTLNRWRGLWRQARARPASFARTAPYTADLVMPAEGFPAAKALTSVQETLERMGFRVHVESSVDAGEGASDGKVSTQITGTRNRLSPLATLVTHLAVLLLLLGVALSDVYGQRKLVSIPSKESVALSHGDGLALRNDGFSIHREADGSVENYQAEVTLLKQGQAIARGTLEINAPLNHQGTHVYLSSYSGSGTHVTLSVWVVHDPGYMVVIAAGFLLLLGLSITFNFPQSHVQAHIGADGTLHLAGRAGRQAYDFGQLFTVLIKELKRRVEEV